MPRTKLLTQHDPVESDDDQYEYDYEEEAYSNDERGEDVGFDHDEDEEENEEYNEDEQEEDYGEEEDSDDEEDEQTKLAELKRSLAHVSFEQLAEIKNKMGMKEFQKARKGQATTEPNSKSRGIVSRDQILKDIKDAAGKLKKTDKIIRTKEEMKRTNKHSPMEMSSKKAVSRLREVVTTASVKRRDPRFDKLSGSFNQDLFEKSYTFLEEYKSSEMNMLREQLRKEKDPEEREKLERLLTKMVSQESSAREAKRKKELARERKKTEAELVKQGKQPYFLKRSEKRKLELMDKYEKYGEKNMERILEKRRKKNAAKDHRRSYPDNIAWSKLDHINYAFGIPNQDGQVNGFTDSQLQKAVGDAHKNNRTISLSVGGWTGSLYFSDLVISDSARDKFTDTLVNLVKKYNLDGIDIDWEYPNSENGLSCNKNNAQDTKNYLSFLQLLRKKFDTQFKGEHKLLSLAAATAPFNNENGDPSDTLDKGWGTVLDAVNLMVYDVSGNWNPDTGANAPLYSGDDTDAVSGDHAVKLWTNAGVPADRIVFGVPFYGYTTLVTTAATANRFAVPIDKSQPQIQGDKYDSMGTSPCPNDKPSYSGEFEWRSVVALNITNNQNGWTTFWNQASQTPYAYKASKKQFLSFDNPRSLEAKVNYVNQHGLGGMMIWSLEMDDESHTLLNSLQGVRQGNSTKPNKKKNKHH
ncbi:hypothetical protein EC973_006199 [Apophysomyces ossiformis]|uniref:Ribosomal RNA-processing protein 36 n=1 Tax=Apophysomyces ossiformis TaxID=679940 RepID=A0A8H7ER73_9FUNG|nr:hypothetical protein EC973_006199 [Apophysomyces ossiformis]